MTALGVEWDLFRKAERLLELQASQGAALKTMEDMIGALDRRLIRLEEREGMMVAEATAAAR